MDQYTEEDVNKSKLNIYAIMLGVDTVEVDDSYFQVGISKRETTFINVKEVMKITSFKKVYVDEELNNFSGFVFYVGMLKDGTKHER